ncbi:acetyl-CoA carboxylase biotin carboxylase subunit [Geoalkalibacter halelectricus]|uniref:Biotin carboxylase n=1 Tax=Geoalkalibacter halelectricus TaxID=2847045 RepID=A0ABY5ZTK9_9BACT|nr:acetyl-CoA carboxylase biotin carboxylase subunit [Geoalkalibacter halelectricus]MDO3376757.1 acetyl-CoA carboxylase biotin carboxylase subunit [Geoalkalibacter halelectricus]UWZ81292.1 acetyl-CoA carboxylase biotin carboxylase subunit [Geoalkalibacter halelectricus]
MFNKILIANRGEIAIRVIRACKELGIKTVAVHSDVDSESLHVKLADESICIGPAPSAKSYLNIKAIISAAEVTDASAIHPGYGFLSENAEFAEICANCGITFIGPGPESMRLMGDKISARQTVTKAGVPILPGTTEGVKSPEEAKRIAGDIGYPVIIKATAGGGGRGMKVVHSPASLPNAFATARAEAQAGFGNPDVYIEKFCERPRHVEIQIMADQHGNVIHLGERDCSIQRRHQKLIEEAPCPVLSEELRQEMGACAVAAAKAVGYSSVGTVEFLLDQGKNFYFMEMNTRVQVEHPVTEMVTGIDIIKEQIRSAAGHPLRFKQEDIQIRGHAIECRINAEDPEKFTPFPGKIVGYHPPGGLGVRVDSGVYDQYKVLPHYDSMIAKLIVHAETRDEAIKKMATALDEYIIDGIKTTISFHQKIMKSKEFIEGDVDTGFLERVIL